MFFEAAAAIADRLEREALWHAGCCSWVGAAQSPEEPWRVDYRALGPDLYGGTAGIGLYLALLGRRRTALGALRHAVTYAEPSHGFHVGVLGTAWAAVAAGTLLDAEEPVAAGHALSAAAPAPGTPAELAHPTLDAIDRAAAAPAPGTPAELAHPTPSAIDRATAAPAPSTPAELAGGIAGELLAHLAFGAIGRATAAGEALIAAGPPRLCGLAHGAAGVGWALLELFAATGEERFRAAGEAAFAHERGWLDPARGQWPDLRVPGHRRGAPHPVRSPVFGTWCRGEAGALLAWRRAPALLGEAFDDAACAPALAATRHHVSEALGRDFADVSLCHGLAGAADVLLTVGEDAPARALGSALLERYPAHDWPSAAGADVVPGLFRGMTGTAWFLLRLHDSTIPSPVGLPRSFDFRSAVA